MLDSLTLSPILVFGAGGLVAGELLRLLRARGLAHHSRTHQECDITDEDAVSCAITETGAQLSINCAAYNAVDRAESEPQVAQQVNAGGPAILARQSPAILHYSTDYVFDGAARTPYVEDDLPSPLSAYARSKSSGDAAVRASNPRHFLLRVGCIYGHGGKTFGSTVLARLLRGEQVKADAERLVQPTWARSVADQTLAVIETGQFGLFHSMSHGATTWADFTRELCRLAGLSPSLVEPVATDSILAAAVRPRYTVLENRALAQAGIDRMPDWQTALSRYLAIELRLTSTSDSPAESPE